MLCSPAAFYKKPEYKTLSGRFEELQNKFSDRYVILHQDLELEIVRGEPPAMDPASDEEPAEAVKLSVTVVTETDYGDERTFELDKQAVLQHSPVLRHLAIEQGARCTECPNMWSLYIGLLYWCTAGG